MSMAELFLLIEKTRELRREEQRFLGMIQGHGDIFGDSGGPGWKFDEGNEDILAAGGDGLFGVNIQ